MTRPGTISNTWRLRSSSSCRLAWQFALGDDAKPDTLLQCGLCAVRRAIAICGLGCGGVAAAATTAKVIATAAQPRNQAQQHPTLKQQVCRELHGPVAC